MNFTIRGIEFTTDILNGTRGRSAGDTAGSGISCTQVDGGTHPQLDESISAYSGALGETRRYVSGYASPRLRPDHLARCRPIEIGS